MRYVGGREGDNIPATHGPMAGAIRRFTNASTLQQEEAEEMVKNKSRLLLDSLDPSIQMPVVAQSIAEVVPDASVFEHMAMFDNSQRY